MTGATQTAAVNGWGSSRPAAAVPLARWELLALVAIVAVAFFFRLWQLDSVPVGLHYDEAGEALDALRNLEIGHRVYSRAQGGREGLYAGIVAAVFALFGPSSLALRAVAAVSGALVVPLTYLILRTLLSGDEANAGRVRAVALLGALGMATAYWQIHLTRLGLRHTLYPLVASLAVYFLWRGFRGGRWLDFGLAGAFLGLSMYTYLSARFVPLLWSVFLLGQALVVWVLRRFNAGRPGDDIFLDRFFRPLLLAALVSVLAFLPLGAYYYRHPAEFVGRAGEVSIFNPDLNQGHLGRALAHSLWGNFSAVALNGDPDPLVNQPGRPLLDGWLVPFFGLGLLVAFRRLARPAYLFLLLWLFVLWLPAVLTYDVVPRFMRAFGIGPALYGLLGLGVVTAVEWLARLRPGRREIARWGGLVLAVLLFAPTAVRTYHDYFLVWARSDAAYETLYQPYAEIGRRMNADPAAAETLYVFPTDMRINYHNRQHYILDFLFVEDLGYLRDKGDTRYTFVQMDEIQMFEQLTVRARGKTVVQLFDLKRGLQREADPKRLMPFLLEKYGTHVSSESFRDYQVHTYRLDSPQTVFTAAERWQPVEAILAEGLTLRAFGLGSAAGSEAAIAADETAAGVPAGESAWLVLHWQTAHPGREDFKATVRLVDEAGHVLVQQDNFILSRYHLPLTGWHPGEQDLDFYLLDVPPDAAPGQYWVTVGVYSPHSLHLQREPLTLARLTVLPAGGEYYPASGRQLPAWDNPDGQPIWSESAWSGP